MGAELRKRVTLDNTTHRKGEAAASGMGTTLGIYASAAVEYFATRGLDPRETEAREGQLIMQQIKKLGNRVFGFLQEQERSLLTGILEEMLRTRITLDRVLRLNEILVSNLNSRLEMLSEAQLKQQQEALKLLRSRNEEAIVKQTSEALTAAKKAGPGRRAKAEAGPGE